MLAVSPRREAIRSGGEPVSDDTQPYNLSSTYLRLRSDVTIEALQADATFWPRLMSGQLGNFHNEYLMTVFDYARDWTHWEMHPNGDELVCVLSGAAVMLLEQSGQQQAVRLEKPGEFVLVPKGAWHTAKIGIECRMLFVTAGEGTQHRSL
jgi:mannose-6-phosphate isomerase-like protein (cupin superfamily)